MMKTNLTLLLLICLAGMSSSAMSSSAAEPSTAEQGIRFRDASSTWGLEFQHHHGGSGQRYMVETMVGGVVIFDYDQDGDDDVFFVDGGALPGYEGEAPASRLFRNDLQKGLPGDGPRFVDVTDASGIQVSAYGAGAIAGDVDGDGDLDLYVTAFGPNQLFLNQGDGSFADNTARAGVGEERWSMGASFADVDGDGDLDLYVTNYVDFTLGNHIFCGVKSQNIRSYCHPDAYNGVPDRFYKNRGDGTFEDTTLAAGFAKTDGKGLGVVFGDLTRSGQPDLYVANDMTPNFVFLGRGDGTFEDISLLSGATYSDQGRPEAGMGVDLADVDRDGLLDIVVTHFELQTNALYKNQGDGLFSDLRFPLGIAEPSLLKLAFGVAFADFDLDGDPDLVVANGHINDNAEVLGSETPYKQPNQVFELQALGSSGRRYREVKDAGLDAIRSSRGLAVGDLDLDGDADVVIVNSNDRAEVYENLSQGNGWLAVDLWINEGNRLGLNRFGIGTRLELIVADAVVVREVRTGSSYLSQNSLRVHFGTGQASPNTGHLRIIAPDGKRQEWRHLPILHRLRFP